MMLYVYSLSSESRRLMLVNANAVHSRQAERGTFGGQLEEVLLCHVPGRSVVIVP